MSYTLLRVDGTGVVLADYHARRFGAALDAFWAFAATAGPGVWALELRAGGLVSEPRPGSRLHDGMTIRVRTSPLGPGETRLAKPAPPSRYDAARCAGVATLLTSPDGAELWEACSAAVLGWDGDRIVCAPLDRPRVLSTTEAAVREHLPFGEAPLAAASPMPLLLVNAVKGTCMVDLPGRAPFPAAARAQIDQLLTSTAARRPR